LSVAAPPSAPAQIVLSLITGFENYTVFKPNPHHAESLGTLLDQVVAWSKALKTLRVS